MADAIDLIGTVQRLHSHAKVDDVSSFEQITGALVNLENELREAYQRAFVAPMTAIIAKLRAGRAPDADELALTESFLVGDAEAYVRLENDFQGWITELDRLVTVLIHLRARLDPPQLLDARGEVEDARRVLGNICNYLQARERVARYRRTIADGLDATRAGLLADLLQQKLDSSED
jgi:hypothetical protein